MAKRRKLQAPSSADMDRIEEEFLRETPGLARAAPIAQVAADAAAAYQTGTAEERATSARDEADATAYRAATDAGRVILEIPVSDIELVSIPRDRMVLDKDALAELEHSMNVHGQRLPIEVYAQKNADKPYGLISGYRRLLAQQNLYARTGMPAFATVKAVLRDPDQMGGAFVAMVEENEIRQDLSHYERGRIAVIAAQQSAFHNTEEAVAEMFASASKAKRSKIRSFAMIFEELGDMLNFPESMREKDGLRVASALRGGAEARLREVLGAADIPDSATEWALIEAVLAEQSETTRDPKRGGRPSIRVPKSGWQGQDVLRTSTGVSMRYEGDSSGYVIRFKGRGVDAELMEMLMLDIREKLEKF